MTVKLLTPYDKYPANAIVTLDAGTEAGLIAAKMAESNTTGGVVWTAPVEPTQYYDAQLAVRPDAIAGLVGADRKFNLMRDAEIAAPVSNLSSAAGAAGALTGTYYYTAVFVTAAGLTSAPWPGTATGVVLSSQRANLTSIPVSSDPRVVARWIYRSPATPVDPKDLRFVAAINDNTTTTYTDNLADGSLGAPLDWLGSASGVMYSSAGKVMAGLGVGAQAFSVGVEAGSGYACTSVGYQALKNNTTGRRNTAMGVYALAEMTTGYQNTAIGTHSGGGTSSGVANTFLGYAAGGTTAAATNFNVAVGNEALFGTGATTGSGNVAVGYRALQNINTADNCIGLGFNAGRYANTSRQVFIDVVDRTNITNAQNVGLIYGKCEGTAISQVLHLNAPTRVGPPSVAVASLPAAAAAYEGFRAFVTDASATTYASIVAGGGANKVPVYCDGTNWRIG